LTINKTSKILFVSLFAFLLISQLATIPSAFGHVYTQIPIKLKKLPGADGIDMEKAFQNLAKIEEMLDQCRDKEHPNFVKFTPIFDKVGDWTDPRNGKAMRGEMPKGLAMDDDNEIRDDKMEHHDRFDPFNEHKNWKNIMVQELEQLDKAGEGPAIILLISHSIIHRDKDGNLHRDTIGINVVGLPVGAVNADASPTAWLHELGHGAGLNHDKDNPPPRDNVMHPTDYGGTKLTPEQCKKFHELFSSFNPDVGYTAEQKVTPPTLAVAMIDFLDQQVTTLGIASTPRNIVTGNISSDYGYLDPFLGWFIFNSNIGQEKMKLTIYFEDSFPSEEINATYKILLNTDNSEKTGIALVFDFNENLGIDKIVRVNVQGNFPFESSEDSLTAFIIDATTEQIISLPNPTVFRHTLADADDRILFDSLTVNISDLGEISNPIQVGFDIYSDDTVNTVSQIEVATRNMEPSLQASSLIVDYNEKVQIKGSDFSPDSNVMFFWDGDFMNPITSVKTNSDGSLQTIIEIPKEIPPGNYVVDAIDENNIDGIIVFTIESPSGNSISVTHSDIHGNEITSLTKNKQAYAKVIVTTTKDVSGELSLKVVDSSGNSLSISNIDTKFPEGSLEFILSYYFPENIDMKNITLEATLTPEGFPIIYGKSSEVKISE